MSAGGKVIAQELKPFITSPIQSTSTCSRWYQVTQYIFCETCSSGVARPVNKFAKHCGHARSPMQKPPKPENEEARLAALRSLNILDSSPEERFDRLTRIAKRLFNVPIALVSLVDEGRQWFKSSQGLSASETSREISFCGHTILGDGVFLIPDATQDERFHDNPLVIGEPNVR